MPLPLFFRRLLKPKPTIYFISAEESRDSRKIVNMLQDSLYQMKRGDPARLGKFKKTIVLYDEMVDQRRLFDLLTLHKFDILILIGGDTSLKYYDATVLADRCITVERRGMDGVGAARRAILTTLGISIEPTLGHYSEFRSGSKDFVSSTYFN